MTDYRKLPLGPLGIGRIGDIVECPICKEHALEVEDYKNPTSGSREKETVYVHFDVPLPIRLIEENKKIVGIGQITSQLLAIKSNSRSEIMFGVVRDFAKGRFHCFLVSGKNPN